MPPKERKTASIGRGAAKVRSESGRKVTSEQIVAMLPLVLEKMNERCADVLRGNTLSMKEHPQGEIRFPTFAPYHIPINPKGWMLINGPDGCPMIWGPSDNLSLCRLHPKATEGHTVLEADEEKGTWSGTFRLQDEVWTTTSADGGKWTKQ